MARFGFVRKRVRRGIGGLFLGARQALWPQWLNPCQRGLIWNGVLHNCATILSSGAFVTGFMVALGASDTLVGLISNSAVWTMIAGVLVAQFFYTGRNRRHVLLYLTVAFRALTCLPVFLPLLLGFSRASVLLAAGSIIAGNLAYGIFSVGYNVWFMDSLPQQGRNDYIYLRMLWIRLCFSLCLLGAGIFLDAVGRSYGGFVVLFSLAMVLTVFDCVVLWRMRGADCLRQGQPRIRAKGFMAPLGNARFVLYLAFILLFWTALYITMVYTTLYQVKYLRLGYGFLSIYNVATYIVMSLSTLLWRRLSARAGESRVMCAGALLMAAEFLAYGFLTTDTLWLLAIAAVLAGFGTGGFVIASFTFRYLLMPQDQYTAYEGWFFLVYGVSALLGNAIGAQLQRALVAWQTDFFSTFQLGYLISAAAAIVIVLGHAVLDARLSRSAGVSAPGQVQAGNL